MEKDVLMITNPNVKEVLSRKRTYSVFVLFTSTDKKYEDEGRMDLDMVVNPARHWKKE